MSIVTLANRRRKFKRRRREHKLERCNRRRRLKDRNFDNVFERKDRL